MCRPCLAPRRGGQALSQLAKAPCPGISTKLAQVVSNPRGHLITALDCTHQPPILFCLACHRSTTTGSIGLLSDQGRSCPADKGTPQQASAWHKKYKYLHTKVFEKRIPPIKVRADAGERVHAVIPLSDDPRIRTQLRHHQEHFQQSRFDDFCALTGVQGNSQASSSNEIAPSHSLSPPPSSGRARRRSLPYGPTVSLLSAAERSIFGNGGLQQFAPTFVPSVDGALHPSQPPAHRTASPLSRAPSSARSR